MPEHATDAELLSYIDAELPESLALEMEMHLERCVSCTRHYWALRDASSHATEVCRRTAAVEETTIRESRDRLTEGMRADVERRWTRRAPMVLALTAAVLFVTLRYETSLFEGSFFLERGALPMSSMTPGASHDVGIEHVCGSVGRTPPVVPAALRQQVLRDYRMEHIPPSEYELDYLVTPELGGLTDRRNLWPEPYGLRSWNARAKDALENHLPRLVCSGQIDLATAQREIADNWIDAYKKYLASERPIQLHARILLATPQTRDW